MVQIDRHCRAMGALLACAMSLQATGALPLVASAEAASCCCQHDKSRACRCPKCTHARELASNQRFIRTCASSSEPALILVQVATAVPQSGLLAPAAAPDASPVSPAQLEAPSPDREVPTPPPLASRRR
jgi:hypothetical protein